MTKGWRVGVRGGSIGRGVISDKWQANSTSLKVPPSPSPQELVAEDAP